MPTLRADRRRLLKRARRPCEGRGITCHTGKGLPRGPRDGMRSTRYNAEIRKGGWASRSRGVFSISPPLAENDSEGRYARTGPRFNTQLEISFAVAVFPVLQPLPIVDVLRVQRSDISGLGRPKCTLRSIAAVRVT